MMVLAAAAQIRFSAAQVHALFDAVLHDDVVDPHVELPQAIPAVGDRAGLAACFTLAHQLWADGVDRSAMNSLLAKLLARGDLDPADRLAYKYIRARFKHLRFALVLYDRRHRSPLLFKWVTALQGHLQDAFRNGQKVSVRLLALLLRCLTTRPAWWLLSREAGQVRLEDKAGFEVFVASQFATLRKAVSAPHLTGKQFHAARKIISRYVSFIDTLRTIHPGEDAWKMSRYLSAINGLMGGLHDDLVKAHATKAGDYSKDPIVLPEDIAVRLRALLARMEPAL